MQMVDHTYSHTSQQEHEACGALPVFYLAFHQIEPQLFQYDLLAQILSDLSVQSSWTACPTTDRPCHARQEHATVSEYQTPLNLQCLQTWPYIKIDSKCHLTPKQIMAEKIHLVFSLLPSLSLPPTYFTRSPSQRKSPGFTRQVLHETGQPFCQSIMLDKTKAW